MTTKRKPIPLPTVISVTSDAYRRFVQLAPQDREAAMAMLTAALRHAPAGGPADEEEPPLLFVRARSDEAAA
jgi:hypothetical protein